MATVGGKYFGTLEAISGACILGMLLYYFATSGAAFMTIGASPWKGLRLAVGACLSPLVAIGVATLTHYLLQGPLGSAASVAMGEVLLTVTLSPWLVRSYRMMRG
jgi:hypothetical protein